ncbi:TSUP family transporter [Streptomyces ficellus]|uniref:Probable membrane transporter protein n=1 Tax=Streptomyces ficellus TaxID=1977088 RepID=A0ABT7Z557_9ACTN|nr:TSUP family transporter [Streptomyces ficellus]MDN3294624.1 TSUP family transporter [Streptomyces ficellus]
MEWQAVVALLAVAAMAGWVDAVVGGGGLLQLPALLVTANAYPVASVLGTNKLAATLGTFTAALVYRRKHPISRKVAAVGGSAAIAGSAGGAMVATAVSSDFLRPVILALLIAVAAFVLMRPQFGTSTTADLDAYRDAPDRRHVARLVLLAGTGIGFYDGLVGPGTGTFLIISFTTLLSLTFIQALSTVKMINVGTNLGALLVFAVQGHVLWVLGLGMSVFNVAGALVGARMTMSRGSGFIRGVLLVVVAAMVLRLGYDEFT